MTIGAAATLLAVVAVTGRSTGRTIGRVETTPASDGLAGPRPTAQAVRPAPPSQLVAVASGGVLLGLAGTRLGDGCWRPGPAGRPMRVWVAYAVIPPSGGQQQLRVAAASGAQDTAVWQGHAAPRAWSSSGPDLLSIEPAGGGLAVVRPDRCNAVGAGRPAVPSSARRGAVRP